MIGKIDWTYIGVIFSVAFGWFLNEIGQWLRTRKEDKKIKKQILFKLLETHFTLNKFDTSQIINLLTERIMLRIPEHKQTEEAKQFLNHIYSSIIGGLVEDNVAGSIDEIEETYTATVNELSKIDPITAFRLNGKTKVFQTFNLLQDYFDKIKEKFPDEIDLDNKIELTVETIKPEIIRVSSKRCNLLKYNEISEENACINARIYVYLG